MSYQNVLKTLYGSEPILDTKRAILSAPVRHVFMMATVWYLTKQGKRDDLNIMEIGSWYGASALSWGQGLTLYNDAKGTISCVDAWAPFFDTEEHKDEDYVKGMEADLLSDTAYNIFLHNMSTLPETIVAQHFRGQSDNILPQLKDDNFDVVFIDADHTYEPVKRDILNSMRLVKDGGIICGDDLNLQMHQCDAEHVKNHSNHDCVKDPKSGRNYHPGVTLAVSEIFGEVSMYGGFWAIQKKGDSWQKISLEGMPVVYPKHFPDNAVAAAEDHFNDIKVA